MTGIKYGKDRHLCFGLDEDGVIVAIGSGLGRTPEEAEESFDDALSRGRKPPRRVTDIIAAGTRQWRYVAGMRLADIAPDAIVVNATR